TQMANFGGGLRELGVGFSIGGKGYVGTGWVNDNPSFLKNDFWEFSPPVPCNTITITTVSQNILCNGQCTGTGTANPSNGISPYTYNWSNGQTTQTSTGLCAGAYTITVTDSLNNSVTSTVIVTQPTALTATVSSSSATCLNNDGSASVIVSGGTPGYTYLWSPGLQTTSTATGLPSGTYTVLVNDANGCAAQKLIATVTVTPTPVAFFEASLDRCTRCLELTDKSTNANSWFWNFGDNATSTMQNPVHCFSTDGIYITTLTVSSSPQCKNVFSMTDSIFGYEFVLVIPNVFTPNSDGVNDVFSISGSNTCSPYSLKIYDRWGILIFETEKSGFAWDGRTSAGIPAHEGTYYYVLQNAASTKKGFVTLLR
ncbi:MAG: gliding motility-associated C-terminal domain-containing protein, partial [Bacteroidia bacterium]